MNMIVPTNGTPRVSPETLVALLNSTVVDDVFRCISGSVAVSAYELEALPLPSPQALTELERQLQAGVPHEIVESFVQKLYGVDLNSS